MKKLLAVTFIAFTLVMPAKAFDIGTIDGLPADMKDMIAKRSGGRITNDQNQSGQEGQPHGRHARKKQSAQDKAMQKADEVMKGDSSIGQAIGNLR